MFGLGVMEIVLILIVALVIVGPEKLPELAKTIAKAFNEFKRTTNDIKRTIDWSGEPAPPESSARKSDEVEGEGEPEAEVTNEPIEKVVKPKKKTPKKTAKKPATKKKTTKGNGSKKEGSS